MKLINNYSRAEIEKGIDIPKNWIIISISEPGNIRANLTLYENLKFYFDFWDIEYPVDLIGGGVVEPMTDKEAESIYEILKLGKNIVCHCHAGRSRSAAVCKFAQDYLGYKWLGKDNPINKPNNLVIKRLVSIHNFYIAKSAYINGDECPELYEIESDLDIEIAENGIDRDSTENEIDEYREKRLYEIFGL